MRGIEAITTRSHAWWDRASIRHNSWRATKYYRFNGQMVARRKNKVLTYLYSDRDPHGRGSTFATTYSSGTFSGHEGYYAYGRQRYGYELDTENRFTAPKGHSKLDGVVLQPFSA